MDIDETNIFQLNFFSRIKTVAPQVWAVCGSDTLTKQTCAAQEPLESTCLFPVLQLL